MTLTATATDQDLVLATRRGQDRAYEQLYTRYRQRIAGYCHRLLGDHDRADDIAQEVFISALRRLRETDRPIVFRPWIYEIARNACIDEYRRRSRVHEIPIERDGELVWTGRSAPAPEVVIESKQALDDLRGAFRGLSDRHHQIIVLRELEGMSYRQIGDRLGMSKMVVESTLFRARRRLSEEYEDLASGRRCEHVLELLSVDRPKRLGVRERRALNSHLEHCRSCRREARSRDVEVVERLTRRRPVDKVAALLPIPLLRLPWRLGARASHSGRGLLQAAGPAGASASGYSDTLLALVGSGRAAAAAATLLAAVGGGVATTNLVAGGNGRGAAASAAQVRSLGSRGSAPVGATGQLGAGSVAGGRAGAAPGAGFGWPHGDGSMGGWGTPGAGAASPGGARGAAAAAGGSGTGAGGSGGTAGQTGGAAGRVTGAANGIAGTEPSLPSGSTLGVPGSPGSVAAPLNGAAGAIGSASNSAGGAVGHILTTSPSGTPSGGGSGGSGGTGGSSGTGVSAPSGGSLSSTGSQAAPTTGPGGPAGAVHVLGRIVSRALQPVS